MFIQVYICLISHLVCSQSMYLVFLDHTRRYCLDYHKENIVCFILILFCAQGGGGGGFVVVVFQGLFLLIKKNLIH